MRQSCLANPTLAVAALLSGLLLATSSVPLKAQPAIESHHGIGTGYDAAHEITLEGTIEQVQTRHVTGSPAGLHLMIAGPKGMVDAHLGALLSRQTKELLLAGMPVKIVGAMTTSRGKSYLLTRLLTIGDRTVKVRGKSGIPEMDLSNAKWHPHKTSANKRSQTESTGGAR